VEPTLDDEEWVAGGKRKKTQRHFPEIGPPFRPVERRKKGKGEPAAWRDDRLFSSRSLCDHVCRTRGGKRRERIPRWRYGGYRLKKGGKKEGQRILPRFRSAAGSARPKVRPRRPPGSGDGKGKNGAAMQAPVPTALPLTISTARNSPLRKKKVTRESQPSRRGSYSPRDRGRFHRVRVPPKEERAVEAARR